MRIKPSKCLSCGAELDAASGVREQPGKRGAFDVSEHVRPRAGDATVCIRCGHLMVFTDDGGLRDLSGDEIRDYAGDRRILAIQRARGSLFSTHGGRCPHDLPRDMCEQCKSANKSASTP